MRVVADTNTVVSGLLWRGAPRKVLDVVLDDPDDDAVLACALTAKAEVIVSGDSHLLSLKDYEGIDIFTAPKLLARIPIE
jgi:predicted nucleic acid-binding protein